MKKISIIGLGYVGLPLALEFCKYFKVTGFDQNKKRIKDLNKGIDITNESSPTILKKCLKKNLLVTSNHTNINNSDYFIITVPTPIHKNKKPNLKYIKLATNLVSKKLKKDGFIIYESTVYPGLIEEICLPIILKNTKLKLNYDFYIGYSPERINPGDKKHNLTSIVKIVSASSKKGLDIIDNLYKKIIKAGTFRAQSIKIAEAAKVIENTQRDINIGFVNELSTIFNKMNINIFDVLDAAKTKWNFLDFVPGLVGGHCIGVDPYYLTYKAKKLGINPKIILSGRKLNDSMSINIANKINSNLKIFKHQNGKPRLLVMGLSFKENCPDIRNSKIFDIIDFFLKKKIYVDLYDNNIDKKLLNKRYRSLLVNHLKENNYEIIIIAVAHNEFKKMGARKIKKLGKNVSKIYDLKNIFKNKLFIKF